jgi:GNAT superfamily N-acetyltransferase
MSNHNSQPQFSTPNSGELGNIVLALREWQQDGYVVQLHPGDLGWYGRYGSDATVKALRQWTREGELLAIGLLDGPEIARLAINPLAESDERLTEQIAQDITQANGEVPSFEPAYIEARSSTLLRDKLLARGWKVGEPWTSLRLDLAKPIEDSALRIEEVGPDLASVRTELQRASFSNSSFTEKNWHNMAESLPYTDSKCLIGYDKDDNAVATVTVWSAGAEKPGLIEPLGVSQNYRHKGHGKAITLAAAIALKEMGSSSVFVCTDSSNTGAVATYKSAGFEELPEVRDLERACKNL